MTTIAITGASGYFAKVLLPLLEADSAIHRILGVDRRSFAESLPPGLMTFHQRDILTDNLEDVLDGADVLLHMAFILMRRPGDRRVDTVNVEGSRRVIDTAVEAGVKKIIFTSSVVAYGLRPGNPIPLSEEMPLWPEQPLYYGRAKAQIEAYLDQIEADHPEIMITRLRPCTVVGPTADPAQMQSLVGEITPLVRGYDPPYQILDERDLAQALLLAIQTDLPGAYNVTSDEPRTLRDLVALRGGLALELPLPLVKLFFRIAWLFGLTVFAPEWVALSQYPLVASNEKLKDAGWIPRMTTEQAYLALQAHYHKPAAAPSFRGIK